MRTQREEMVPASLLREARERIEELEEQVRQQSDEGPDRAYRIAVIRALWRCTECEAYVLEALLNARYPVRYEMMDDWPSDGDPDPKIVDIFVCKLRRLLAPFGIAIETMWGRGYFMKPDIKSAVEKAISGQGSRYVGEPLPRRRRNSSSVASWLQFFPDTHGIFADGYAKAAGINTNAAFGRLNSMIRAGYVTKTTVPAPRGHPRKKYSLTESGRRVKSEGCS